MHFTGDWQQKILIADYSPREKKKKKKRVKFLSVETTEKQIIIATWSWTRELFSLMIQIKNLRKKFARKCFPREKHLREAMLGQPDI